MLSSRDGAHIGHVDGGVIVDLAGDTLAVTEMGIGAGYPPDFFPMNRAQTELGEATTRSAAVDTPGLSASGTPTGQWSTRDFETTLDNL